MKWQNQIICQYLCRPYYSNMQPDHIVKINVNGKFFLTTKETFSKYQESKFGSLLKGQNESGVYYIDQDSKLFETILDLLRFGRVSRCTKLDRLKKSTKKFQFKELQDKIEAEITKRNSFDDYLAAIAMFKAEMQSKWKAMDDSKSEDSISSDFEILEQ